jgi:hypothetical protein
MTRLNPTSEGRVVEMVGLSQTMAWASQVRLVTPIARQLGQLWRRGARERTSGHDCESRAECCEADTATGKGPAVTVPVDQDRDDTSNSSRQADLKLPSHYGVADEDNVRGLGSVSARFVQPVHSSAEQIRGERNKSAVQKRTKSTDGLPNCTENSSFTRTISLEHATAIRGQYHAHPYDLCSVSKSLLST